MPTTTHATPIDDTSPYTAPFPRKPSPAELTALGRELFFETRLSGNGKMSCATCHDPQHAFAPAQNTPTVKGGIDGKASGVRAVPSLRYRQFTPMFTEHFFDNDGNDSEDQGPTGGFMWDGRAATAHDQAALPLLASNEMANTSPQSVIHQLSHSPSAQSFTRTFGTAIWQQPQLAWLGVLWSLEVYQQDSATFAPFSSHFDDVMRGKAKFSAQQLRGMQLFAAKDKGNCASCHTMQSRGGLPLFTDMGHIALGVPRNNAIAANHQPQWFDLGLCGPLRSDTASHPEWCGRFKTPSLRNVATRQVFFHNGVYHRLSDAVRFYALRDTQPQRVYPLDANGQTIKLNDLPAQYHGNVNTDPPFGPQKRNKPVLSEQDIADIAAVADNAMSAIHIQS
jgi:cytochrome c peroxidase